MRKSYFVGFRWFIHEYRQEAELWFLRLTSVDSDVGVQRVVPVR